MAYASNSSKLTTITIPKLTKTGVDYTKVEYVDVYMDWSLNDACDSVDFSIYYGTEVTYLLSAVFTINVEFSGNKSSYKTAKTTLVKNFLPDKTQSVDLSGKTQLDIKVEMTYDGTMFDLPTPHHPELVKNYFNFDASVSNVASLYTAPTLDSFTINSSTTDSVNLTVKWTAGSETITTYEAYTTNNEDGWVSISNDVETTMNNLQPNTYYSFEAKISDGTTEKTEKAYYWTHPVMDKLELVLVNGLEHDKINAKCSAKVTSSYDQFAFNLSSTSWSAWGGGEFNFDNLAEYTEYTIYAKMKNTSSGFESESISSVLRTWYDPLTNLTIINSERWYWYLQIYTTYTYSGTISKFEFAISDSEGYQDKGTNNLYSKGSRTENASGNLLPHTLYNCYVKLTDNHGRQYTKKAQFYTLEDRVAYIIESNGSTTFVQAYIVESNGTTKQMTPDLVAVVEANGSTTNFPNEFP